MRAWIIFVVFGLSLTSALDFEQKKQNLIKELNQKGELFSNSAQRYGGYGRRYGGQYPYGGGQDNQYGSPYGGNQYGNPYGGLFGQNNNPYGGYGSNYYYTTVGFPFNLFTTQPPPPFPFNLFATTPPPFPLNLLGKK
jgi:hypothetical protein